MIKLRPLQETVISRRVGMADEADSKSVVGNHVRVQVPPPAGKNQQQPVCMSFNLIIGLKNGMSVFRHVFFYSLHSSREQTTSAELVDVIKAAWL